MSDRGCSDFGQKWRSRSARRFGWSGPYGEEFAPNKSASAMTDCKAELLTVIVSSNIAKECVGSNRQLKRTIATSRSDDNPDESRRTKNRYSQKSDYQKVKRQPITPGAEIT
jgi:hypothetical protein